MSTPDFILELRKHIGHMPLWLIGITAYVTDGDGRVLLGRRLDTGEWALVYGINEPAEDPADTVAREVREETGVDVIPTDLVSVKASTRMVTYANGDQTQYLDLTYLCRLDPSGNTSHSWATTKIWAWASSRSTSCPLPCAIHGGTHGVCARVSAQPGPRRRTRAVHIPR